MNKMAGNPSITDHHHQHHQQQHASNKNSPIQIETFSSFPVNQVQKFNILLANHLQASNLVVTISNQILGLIDKQLEWLPSPPASESKPRGKCRVSFRAPIVGVYTIEIELIDATNETTTTSSGGGNSIVQCFQAKAYDLSKVFINGSTGKCLVNESYEFSVDASEAGEGQLEIAVNEGEIPNQVQVLDNGKCIVNFVPEDSVPHVVDIKFNGSNVNGCPFVVEVQPPPSSSSSKTKQADQQQQKPSTTIQQQPPLVAATKAATLIKEERVLVNSVASFTLENLKFDHTTPFDKNDLIILDPESQLVNYKLISDTKYSSYKFEFTPTVVGDYTVEIVQKSQLSTKLPIDLLEQFPFPLKVFDFNKVIVSDVTNGVIGHPIYFFIDASQAGSGNLEIRVSSKTRNVPNHPQSEANAKIRVNFTPTEAVDHYIDVKFNGIPVPGNSFLVKVAQYPQARLPVTSQDLLKYLAIDEFCTFYVDYIGNNMNNNSNNNKEQRNLPIDQLTDKSCQAYVLRPDFVHTKLNTIQLQKLPIGDKSTTNDKQQQAAGAKFKIDFKPTKIGPYKLFITVNNELLPGSPIVSNAYNINEVKVFFGPEEEHNKQQQTVTTTAAAPKKPVGQLDKPMAFTVDASRAGEGTLALAVVSGITRSPVQTDVKVSEKGHGLYILTFVPTEFAPHSIDISFNDRVVPNSPFIVDMMDTGGKLYSEQVTTATSDSNSLSSSSKNRFNTTEQQATSEASAATAAAISHQQQQQQQQQMIQNFEALSLNRKKGSSSKSKQLATHQTISNTTSKKSLAFGLVDASNIVYLESGVLENSKNQVNLIGPTNEKVPFVMGKGSPQPGETRKSYIEYKPKSIGTHTINVLEGGKGLRQYFVEICDPSLIRITDFNLMEQFSLGKPVTFCLDSSESGEIQLDSITILGPTKQQQQQQRSNGKIREGDQTILGRIKSISSSSSSNQAAAPIEYSIVQLSDRKQEVKFIPQVAGRYSIDIRCLGQSVVSSPFGIEVVAEEVSSSQQLDQHQMYSPNITNNGTSNNKNNNNKTTMSSKEDELLQSIVVHGVSLKCSPVNSTGAFIIETNRLAQARDFDVLITDPSNSLVDVQCYLQQDGNLLAEWTPRRVGTHKIEVYYKDRQVPGSPFVTESFDPSGVIIENVKTTVYSVNDRIEFKLNRKEAGYGELDVAITSPVGQDLPIEVIPLSEQDGEEVGAGEIISFTPTVAGKYKMSITFGGYEVPKSPITFVARGNERDSIPRASGTGLRGAEVNRSAQFVVDSASEGELKLRIECGDREIVPKIEKRDNSYGVKYKPTEVGYTTISLYWNGNHLEGSPYSVPTNDLSKILFLSGTNKSISGHHHGSSASSSSMTQTTATNQRVMDYEPRVAKEISVDTSKCGPGDLNAEAYCRANPSIKFSIPVNQYVLNRYKLLFCLPPKPEQLAKGLSLKDISVEATYLIRFYYNNIIVPETLASVVVSPLALATNGSSPSQQRDRSLSRTRRGQLADSISNHKTPLESNNNTNGHAQISKQPFENITKSPNNNNHHHHHLVDGPVVALRGHGLVDARCDEEAEFTIDGSEAGPGKPEVRFSGSSEDVLVRLDDIGERRYKASYVARTPGVYSLNVLWDGKQVAGCPVTVNIVGLCDPTKVLCTGDGLKGGVLGEEIKVLIDTRRAGPGELTALCTGPQKVAFCELLDRDDGTFVLYIKPQEAGRQLLTIKYGGQHITKSPFLIKVSGKPDPSKVRVYGPGVEHGVLSLYQSRFVCDTRGAGAGQLTVRIRGPKGAFRMETQRESQRDRTILCKYDPTEPGDYRIEIKWSGRHVPGSPFSVMIFDTQEELNRFLISGHPNAHPNKLTSHNVGHHAQLPSMLQHHHQVPYQPTLVEYGHYSSMASPTQPQPPYRLQ